MNSLQASAPVSHAYRSSAASDGLSVPPPERGAEALATPNLADISPALDQCIVHAMSRANVAEPLSANRLRSAVIAAVLEGSGPVVVAQRDLESQPGRRLKAAMDNFGIRFEVSGDQAGEDLKLNLAPDASHPFDYGQRLAITLLLDGWAKNDLQGRYRARDCMLAAMLKGCEAMQLEHAALADVSGHLAQHGLRVQSQPLEPALPKTRQRSPWADPMETVALQPAPVLQQPLPSTSSFSPRLSVDDKLQEVRNWLVTLASLSRSRHSLLLEQLGNSLVSWIEPVRQGLPARDKASLMRLIRILVAYVPADPAANPQLRVCIQTLGRVATELERAEVAAIMRDIAAMSGQAAKDGAARIMMRRIQGCLASNRQALLGRLQARMVHLSNFELLEGFNALRGLAQRAQDAQNVAPVPRKAPNRLLGPFVGHRAPGARAVRA